MNEAYEVQGSLNHGGILIIGDHASNHVPGDIDLGISLSLLETHIGWDIGVAGIATILSNMPEYTAITANVSRLVVDLNREADETAAIPHSSDGVVISGNILDAQEFDLRIEKYWQPYHDKITKLIVQMKPSLLLSLHSFTPRLACNPEEARPWEIGILYNEDDRGARIAIPELQSAGLMVGDQLPYSGKLLNATMNRHGEGNNIPYLGVEMRQDLVADRVGQERFAAILAKICQIITEKLACH